MSLISSSLFSNRKERILKKVSQHSEEGKEERASGHGSAQSVDVTHEEQTTHQSYVSLYSTSGTKRYCKNAVQ